MKYHTSTRWYISPVMDTPLWSSVIFTVTLKRPSLIVKKNGVPWVGTA